LKWIVNFHYVQEWIRAYSLRGYFKIVREQCGWCLILTSGHECLYIESWHFHFLSQCAEVVISPNTVTIYYDANPFFPWCAQRSRELPQHQLQCMSVYLYVTGVILTIVGDWGNQLFPSVVLTAFVLSGPHHFANNKIDIFTIIILV